MATAPQTAADRFRICRQRQPLAPYRTHRALPLPLTVAPSIIHRSISRSRGRVAHGVRGRAMTARRGRRRAAASGTGGGHTHTREELHSRSAAAAALARRRGSRWLGGRAPRGPETRRRRARVVGG